MSQRPFDTGPDDAGLADHLVEGQHLIDLAALFVERYSYDRFMSDELVHYSGSMLIIRLREVANRLPQHFRDSHPDVPWRAIVGMGRFITHERANRADPEPVHPVRHRPARHSYPVRLVQRQGNDRATNEPFAVVMQLGDKTELQNRWYPSAVQRIENTLVPDWERNHPSQRAIVRRTR